MDRNETAGVLAPPPLIYLGGFAAGLLLDWLLDLRPLQPGVSIRISGALASGFAGAILISLGLFRFHSKGTAPEPWKPTTSLEVGGIYRFTRNPMYLGMALLLLALALAFASRGALLMLPLVLVVIDRFVIAREERYLERLFGESYRRYLGQVRRWI
ncbi:isoprenylcysteine carboxylmethyltransferase family protein [Sandaracinobacter neustonicus]|uniref:Isoprenylcysteine carboxylmethyltransferase family protein n=1 Tax=Sandaracinobacter neustonicus TaxID=1715348 RepID=A0A501XQV6_9SPHN|nr:isoprenylcysteine carboxylmethyltransferase family protein [Sandaracinobacter neustonicus]TPE62614.1 isoprenylcysteine carboxylmethyltransferase family protein [Sandaracinobacter neustonicus]